MASDEHGPSGKKWDKLIQSVMRGRCVVMLGPDAVTVTTPTGEKVPFLEALRRHLVAELKEDGVPAPESKRLPAVAQVVQDLRGRQRLLEWSDDFYESVTLDDPTLDRIRRLGAGLVVNTVPGLEVDRVLDRDPAVGWYNRRGRAPQPIPDWSVDQPLVYHLYGTCREPESLVLTDGDLVDVLVAVIRGEPALPANLASAFQNPELSFVFLGFQLYHWQRRILLTVLNEGTPKPSESFAQELDRVDLDEGARIFYRMNNKIRIVDMKPDRFLARLLSESDSDAAAHLAEIPFEADSPAAFICHVREDRAAARELAGALERRRINTWIDTSDIPGGAEWNRLIEQTLRHDVGYVVVVQSRNFLRRRDEKQAYVNKEIRLALDRQQMIGSKSVFMIPVFLDDEAERSPDRDLNHLHSLSVANEQGIDELASMIRRDIERQAIR